MKDMFYNYDYNINKRLLSHKKEPAFFDQDVILTGNPNIMIIKDIKGREIGVRVKQGMPFTLYFYLDDYSTAEKASDRPDLCELVLNCKAQLAIFSCRRHISPFEPIELSPENIADNFNLETSTLAITVPQDKANLLDKDSYRIRLRLIDKEDNFYEVYSENDGLLIVR